MRITASIELDDGTVFDVENVREDPHGMAPTRLNGKRYRLLAKFHVGAQGTAWELREF